jgi:arylsulfatase
MGVLQLLHEPFFLYLHYMDPHDPYRPPADQRSFAGDYEGHDFIAEGDPNPIALMLYGDGPEVDVTDDDIQHLVDLYDDEVLHFDAMLRELTTVLRSSGVLDRSIFILTSDHGEEFLEHGHVKHCRGVWDTLTRVPLLMRTTGAPGGTRIDSPVQGVDILPTVLDYLGFESDIVDMEGVSLRSVVDGEGPGRTHAFADQVEYRSADDGRFHLVFNGLESTYALYDVRRDPLEQTDLFASHSDEARGLNLALETWLKETGQWDHFDLALVTAKAKEDQLRALGYLQ